MIQFQRGLDPAKKMGIGQHGIAPEIENFWLLDPERMTLDPATGKMIPAPSRATSARFWEVIITGSDLSRNPRFIGVSFKTETVKGIPAGGIHRLKSLETTFVKYNGDSTRLPKWNSKGEVI